MQEPRTDIIRGKRLLVIDDHRNIRVSLRLTLEAEGAHVSEADCVAAGSALLGLGAAESPALAYDAVLLDIRMPDGSGLDILKSLSQAGHAARVIMISGEGTVSEAFQATQMGAFDYVEKPFTPERILVSVRRCLDFNEIRTANVDLERQVLRGQEILGNHARVHEMMNIIQRVAPTNGRVLIIGESGTGKELVAKALHRFSERKHKPLVKVNCAAIPHSLIESELFGHEKGAFTGAVKARRGLFEQADGGTLFLDEIGELSLDVQAKLLRVLQSGEIGRVGSEKLIHVDVRLLAATHRDLPEMVQAGEFREDLYYRLNVVTINVPALRERRSDIAQLARYFLSEACEEHSVGERAFSERALEQLAAYDWPGNVRELKNLVERVAILSEQQVIETIEELAAAPTARTEPLSPKEISAPGETATATVGESGGEFTMSCRVMPWHEFHQMTDREYIKYVLRRTNGNVSEAARLLCLERAYLHRLMRKLGVQRDIVVHD